MSETSLVSLSQICSNQSSEILAFIIESFRIFPSFTNRLPFPNIVIIQCNLMYITPSFKHFITNTNKSVTIAVMKVTAKECQSILNAFSIISDITNSNGIKLRTSYGQWDCYMKLVISYPDTLYYISYIRLLQCLEQNDYCNNYCLKMTNS